MSQAKTPGAGRLVAEGAAPAGGDHLAGCRIGTEGRSDRLHFPRRRFPVSVWIGLVAVLAAALAGCRSGQSCASGEDGRPIPSAVTDVAAIGIYNAMTPEQRRENGIPDAPAAVLDAGGRLHYPSDAAAYVQYRDWLYHHPNGNGLRGTAGFAESGAGFLEEFPPLQKMFSERNSKYAGDAKDRPRVARVVGEVATAAAAIGIYNALGEERRRQIGVPDVPRHLRDDRIGVDLDGEAERAEFLTWLYHPDSLPDAPPGATNPIGPMADEALRDSGFDRVLRSSELRCS